MATFRNLPPTQAAVFEQIATGNDAGHPSATLKALVRKGLIVEITEHVDFSHIPMAINRYFTPTQIHMEWCAWCVEQPEE